MPHRDLPSSIASLTKLLRLTLALTCGVLAVGLSMFRESEAGFPLLMPALAVAAAACLAGALSMTGRLNGTARSILRETEDRAVRAEAALQQLRESLDELPSGLEIYDSDDRLLLFNKRLVELYPWIKYETKIGSTFESIVRESVSQGRIAPAVGNEEAWLAQRIATRGSREGPILQSLKDGRWINTYERRTPSNFVVGVRLEVTTLVEKTRELESSRAHLQAIIGSAATAILSTDRLGRILELNAAAIRLFGYSDAELVGQPLSRLVPNCCREASDSDSEIASPVRAVQGAETWGLTQTGTLLNLHLSVSEVASVSGLQFVAVITDLTQLKLAQEARLKAERLEAENRRIQEASRLKSQFLANMSHEIRTPLNAIVGLNYLMRREGITGDQSARLDKIDSATRHLLSIINDILDLAKIEAGRMDLECTNFHLAAVLETVQSIVAESARAKGLSLHTDGSAVPLWLRGDPTRLRQALLNFVSNAVKFTEHGSIEIRADLLEEDGDRAFVRFSVEDSGIGISAEQLPRLFEAFVQADASTTRKFGGSGLGLNITRRLVQLMGGDCGASSAPGVGSTFWFSVRLSRGHGVKPPAQAGRPVAAEMELRRRYGGARILLVEDDEVNREVALAMLHGVDLAVDVAVDGREAVEMAGESAYDLVLMDMQMPMMGGIAATRAIRDLPGWQQRPILALTANAFDEDRLACEAAGMNDFIVKPIDANGLYESLLKWLVTENESV